MIKRFIMAAALSTAVAFGFAGPAASADKTDKDTSKSSDSAVKPDNSKANKAQPNRDMSADQQSENAADRKLAQQVRRAIVKDKSLSTYAHNVKVIVRDGNITLKGPVRSEQEKSAVEKAAAKAAGSAKISNELTVAKKESKKDSKDKDKDKKDMKESK